MERDIGQRDTFGNRTVSIHASRMEGDLAANLTRAGPVFQSTPPGWRATVGEAVQHGVESVSIHASRMEGDYNGIRDPTPGSSFNPRLPDGGRPGCALYYGALDEFQSTPPGWRATDCVTEAALDLLVSIHASRMEGDFFEISTTSNRTGFNPRLPDGGRQTIRPITVPAAKFQSTPPGWRATATHVLNALISGVSIHASRMEGDQLLRSVLAVSKKFQSTPRGLDMILHRDPIFGA